MKTFLILPMVFIQLFVHGQADSDIDNISHPFQVLYVEDASYIARSESIKQYDYTNRYGLIRNRGKLILLHYSGYLFESDGGLIDIREIAETFDSEGTYYRPPISADASLAKGDWKTETQYHKIKLLYPWKHTIQLSRHERLPLQWYYEENRPKRNEYEVTIMDIHDKVLLQQRTKENYFEVILDSLALPENLIICHIGIPALNELSDDIVIAFEQEHQVQSALPKHYSVTKYQSFIDGLIAVHKNEFELATKLFHLAIDTHQDPIFEKMYRKLLEDHPKLKSVLE